MTDRAEPADEIGMILDDRTDWDEIAELVTESFAVLAPKRLHARIHPPS